jgi:hypothetical protein
VLLFDVTRGPDVFEDPKVIDGGDMGASILSLSFSFNGEKVGIATVDGEIEVTALRNSKHPELSLKPKRPTWYQLFAFDSTLQAGASISNDSVLAFWPLASAQKPADATEDELIKRGCAAFVRTPSVLEAFCASPR